MVTSQRIVIVFNFIFVVNFYNYQTCHAVPVYSTTSSTDFSNFQIDPSIILITNNITNFTNLTPNDSSFRDIIKTAQLIVNKSTGKSNFFRVIDVLSVIAGSQEQSQQIIYEVILKLYQTSCGKKYNDDYMQCVPIEVSVD